MVKSNIKIKYGLEQMDNLIKMRQMPVSVLHVFTEPFTNEDQESVIGQVVDLFQNMDQTKITMDFLFPPHLIFRL